MTNAIATDMPLPHATSTPVADDFNTHGQAAHWAFVTTDSTGIGTRPAMGTGDGVAPTSGRAETTSTAPEQAGTAADDTTTRNTTTDPHGAGARTDTKTDDTANSNNATTKDAYNDEQLG